MVEESIVFGPEVPDRELDREVGKIERAMSDVDTTVGVNGDAGGLGMPDVDGGGGGEDALGSIESGIGGMNQQLRSRLPASVPAVAGGAAAALPIAIAGGVGMGMLSAMQSASARLQTSASLLSQAWNNVWRPLGDDLDGLFVRDAVEDVVDATRDFEETWRDGDHWDALVNLEDNLIDAVEGAVEAPFRAVFDATRDRALGIDVELMPDAVVGAIGWPEVTAPGVMDAIGWPDVGAEWSGWPDIQGMWPGWPDIETLADPLEATRDAMLDFVSFANSLPGVDIDVPDSRSGGTGDARQPTPEERRLFGGVDDGPDEAVDAPRRQFGGGGGTTPTGPPVAVQRGGVVRGETTARIAEAGPEVVAPLSDFERMVERAARAGADGGGGGGMSDEHAREIRRSLDTVVRELRKTRDSIQSLELKTDRETLARATTKGRGDGVFDSNPLM